MDEIYKQINKLGGRITKTRKEILEALLNSDCLMSQACILGFLKNKNINPK